MPLHLKPSILLPSCGTVSVQFNKWCCKWRAHFLQILFTGIKKEPSNSAFFWIMLYMKLFRQLLQNSIQKDCTSDIIQRLNYLLSLLLAELRAILFSLPVVVCPGCDDISPAPDPMILLALLLQVLHPLGHNLGKNLDNNPPAVTLAWPSVYMYTY